MALKHSVYDSDTHFSINPISRAIKNESTTKTGLIQYDHNSERFTFEMPKIIEGHDMSQCDIVEIHYINIDGKTEITSSGVYPVDDMQIDTTDSNIVIFSWLISQNATKYVGHLNFLVRFACTDDEGNILYVWNTAVHTGIAVSNGIYNSEFVLEQYVDVLEKWRLSVQASSLIDLQQTQVGSEENDGVNIWKATFYDGTPEGFFRELTVKDGKNGHPGSSGSPGIPGKSAYEVAVENGYKGTAQDFINEMIYPKFSLDGVPLKNVIFRVQGDTLYIDTE